MTVEEIITVLDFLGEGITDEQVYRLMDEARQLSSLDKIWLKAHASGAMYTELSMHEGEMGGFDQY